MNEVIEYGITDAALAELKGKYSNVPDVSTKKGYALAKAGISEVRTLRTSVEKKRKELKADALDYGRKVDAAAKKITDALLAIEAPMKDAKKAIDDEQVRIEEEARQAEINRIEEIQGRIADIHKFGEGLLNANSELIQKSIDALNNTVISEKYFGEYCEAAEDAIKATQEILISALNERKAFEDQQAENERVRKEQEAEAKRLAEQQAEIDRQKQADADKRRAEQEEARKKQEEAQAEIDRQREEVEAEKRKQQQAKLDAEREEAEKIKAEKEKLEREKSEKEAAEKQAELEKQEHARIEAMKPDIEKITDFAASMVSLSMPLIADAECRGILTEFIDDVNDAHEILISRIDKISESKAA